MLVELNQSLSDNNCIVEHVIVIDGAAKTNLPADLCPNTTVIATARPVGQAAARLAY